MNNKCSVRSSKKEESAFSLQMEEEGMEFSMKEKIEIEKKKIDKIGRNFCVNQKHLISFINNLEEFAIYVIKRLKFYFHSIGTLKLFCF